ncbi:MAG: 50S ribosomal protein L30 [Thermoproteales archaeon]|nr:50S ribosomal protein L30 [Thermoproteales archaeon]
MQLLAVIRLRGTQGLKPEEEKTLELLNLHKVNHAVLVPDNKVVRGMLKKVEYIVTYGEIDKETLALLLSKRGRLIGNKKITQEYLEEKGFSSFEELANALLTNKISIKDLKEIKPVFRLTPPSGGFKGTIKKHFKEKGELGYRGKDINNILKQMI